ncbi:hypothetical protein GWI33_001174 [Rhynchophorus ferrugineus]|uniref:Uncharacterized protein n=1 Tax=Rhynchophorus ferrugineus TaxID=354439 RepID=A0A834IQP5_RHYFE|nr:hypothetical protein GWI33_001174 [Rhynchophorus ferrugineus]
MVYDSDFYTTRRPYRTSPSYSTYTTSSPRHYVVTDNPDRSRRAEEVYSYSYSSTSDSSSRSGDPYSRPKASSSSFSESVTRSSAGGPGGYSYTSERTSRSRGDGPGGYHSSYSSTSSGNLPGGTSYRHWSYRYEPSRQVKILPGLGKVHIVHSYDRIVPYVGHKRLTVVSTPPKVYSTRPSVLQREYDWIENKVRPWVGYSATNRYLNSDSAVRIYYSNYPITSSYYTTLSLPSSYYYPRVYRWYYNWPRTYYLPSSYYSSYWPSSLDYYWPRSYYSWPYYRSYLSSFFRNYYLSSLPSLYYKSLDYQFSDLENKINNLSVSTGLKLLHSDRLVVAFVLLRKNAYLFEKPHYAGGNQAEK